MSKPWEKQRARMCSFFHTADEITDAFRGNQKSFDATDEDCTIENITKAPDLPLRGPKCHFDVVMHTYRGWKVFMLMTGCLASMPEYEKEG